VRYILSGYGFSNVLNLLMVNDRVNVDGDSSDSESDIVFDDRQVFACLCMSACLSARMDVCVSTLCMYEYMYAYVGVHCLDSRLLHSCYPNDDPLQMHGEHYVH
jgi:hypothetical protein